MVLENGERKGKMIREGRKENECARKRKNLKGGGVGKGGGGGGSKRNDRK